MEKLGLLFKEISGKQIKNKLKESGSIFVINYAKLSSPDLSNLRQSLKNTQASLFVVKNTVARRALAGSRLEELAKNIEGPCGLIFIHDEPVGASRVLCDFSRSHEGLKIQGGFLKDKALEPREIAAMASLPSQEVLRAMLVMTLNAPLSGLVILLNGMLKKFVYCLGQIKNKIGTDTNYGV